MGGFPFEKAGAKVTLFFELAKRRKSI